MAKKVNVKVGEAARERIIRDAVVNYGRSIQDQVLLNISPEYREVVYQIKSIYDAYKRADYDTIKTQLGNIYALDSFLRYLIAMGMVMASLNPNIKMIDALQKFNKSYHELLDSNWFIRDQSKLTRFREVSDLDVDVQTLAKWIRYSKSLWSYVRNNAENKLYIWVLRQKRVEGFENDIRNRIFGGEGGNRVNKSVKTLLRLLIHESNIPLAVYIARNITEIRNYEVIADMFSSMVTIRSGSFEDIRSESVERLKVRIALARRCDERRSANPNIKCSDEVVLRYGDVRGIVRSVARASKDPILFERGAFTIGQLTCRDLNCNMCAIKDVCKKYVQVRFK